MKNRISEKEISSIYKKALKSRGILKKDDTALIFYDLDFLEERLKELKENFPEDTLHAIAIKANPLQAILAKISGAGFGLEAATLPELILALEGGVPEERIVFDSPCKTMEEIEFALQNDIHINADSFDEIERIASLNKDIDSNSPVGLRINPQVGTGAIKSTSVAGSISKFGVPVSPNREKIINMFLRYPWLRGLHLHIGSQGMPLDLLTRGVKIVFEMGEEINIALEKAGINRKLEFFDIGGGLAVSYRFGKIPVGMAEYRKSLEKSVPGLFSGDFRLITEFGRYIHTNTAWAASKVEYVKREKDYNIIMSHLGADFMLRECYNPQDWQHEITVLDKNGNLKNNSPKEKYFIAGPLCFAGDVIGHDIELPRVDEGDVIIIHDVGAYTLSMWSRYNSRQVPQVLGYSKDIYGFEILKKREVLHDTIGFWMEKHSNPKKTDSTQKITASSSFIRQIPPI